MLNEREECGESTGQTCALAVVCQVVLASVRTKIAEAATASVCGFLKSGRRDSKAHLYQGEDVLRDGQGEVRKRMNR